MLKNTKIAEKHATTGIGWLDWLPKRLSKKLLGTDSQRHAQLRKQLRKQFQSAEDLEQKISLIRRTVDLADMGLELTDPFIDFLFQQARKLIEKEDHSRHQPDGIHTKLLDMEGLEERHLVQYYETILPALRSLHVSRKRTLIHCLIKHEQASLQVLAALSETHRACKQDTYPDPELGKPIRRALRAWLGTSPLIDHTEEPTFLGQIHRFELSHSITNPLDLEDPAVRRHLAESGDEGVTVKLLEVINDLPDISSFQARAIFVRAARFSPQSAAKALEQDSEFWATVLSLDDLTPILTASQEEVRRAGFDFSAHLKGSPPSPSQPAGHQRKR